MEWGDEEDDLARDILGLDPEQRERVWPTGLRVDSPWVRDYGPLQVEDNDLGVVWLDAHYFDDRPLDDAVPSILAEQLGQPVRPWEVSLDGGALSSNGTGLCVSTTSFLSHWDVPFRDEENASALLNGLGCQVLVLVPALPREPTRHVDLFLQFVDPNTAVMPAFDPQTRPAEATQIRAAARALREGARRLGQDLDIHWIRSPGVVDGEIVSLVNALQLPRAVVVPVYEAAGPEVREQSLADWADAVPDRDIVPLVMDDWITLGGAVHCSALGLRLAG
jgi:agmatine deiminase